MPDQLVDKLLLVAVASMSMLVGLLFSPRAASFLLGFTILSALEALFHHHYDDETMSGAGRYFISWPMFVLE